MSEKKKKKMLVVLIKSKMKKQKRELGLFVATLAAGRHSAFPADYVVLQHRPIRPLLLARCQICMPVFFPSDCSTSPFYLPLPVEHQSFPVSNSRSTPASGLPFPCSAGCRFVFLFFPLSCLPFPNRSDRFCFACISGGFVCLLQVVEVRL